MSELINIVGIGPDEAELLEATGWTDVRSLAKADVAVLERELSAANSMLQIVGKTPDASKITRWVNAASRVVELEEPKPSSRVETPVNVAKEEPVAIRQRPRGKKAPDVPFSLPDEGEEPSATTGDLAVAIDENEPEAIVDPVNFEADPDVQEMLALAPFALPIPARMLAEKGIAPSEIAMAPLLNHAVGDLEVNVTVERPQRREAPDVPGGGPRRMTASVQVADVGFSTGRRGFDTSRIRSVEEVQGDPRASKPSPHKAGMEDDRISLLRAPLAKTNEGKKAGSKFYIRGVLHDRPLKVWFGGLVTVLLQITMPFALVAAPLLILSGEMPAKFEWVPPWVIVFPLLLPIFGLLYAILSTGAKCRVCSQRLYVPKKCLKNKKAHNFPYFGHIGALAFHVMTFKWFNCTFCGTSIRIKK